MRWLVKKKVKFDLWWPLVTWPLTWPKNDRSSFVMILDALSNAAYRVSLRGPGAELDGDVQTPSPARSTPSTGPSCARVHVQMNPDKDSCETQSKGIPNHTPNFSTYYPTVLEIRKRCPHVRTCSCTGNALPCKAHSYWILKHTMSFNAIDWAIPELQLSGLFWHPSHDSCHVPWWAPMGLAPANTSYREWKHSLAL